MSDADDLDAASDLVDSGPAVKQGHSIGDYGYNSFPVINVPDKPEAKMSGVPPEHWAAPVKKNR